MLNLNIKKIHKVTNQKSNYSALTSIALKTNGKNNLNSDFFQTGLDIQAPTYAYYLTGNVAAKVAG